MSPFPDSAGFFREDLCTRCGECFVRCRYLELSREEAEAEIGRLIEGRPTRFVMQKCISCASCDVFCPEKAEPYQLILARWDRRYRETGLPLRASYMLPYQVPNYRQDAVPLMTARERELLARWKSEPARGEVLFPGCNLLTLPLLFDLRVFHSLPVAGDWSLCCGEPLYRLGAFEAVEQIARGLSDYYAKRRIAKMVFVCPACLNMFQTVLPQRFGARFDFECEYIAPWLLRRFESGEIKVERPLDRRMAVHDSCHGRLQGAPIMDTTRELYRRLGVEVMESHSRPEDGICCGIAAGCNRQMPQDIVAVGRRALREGLAVGAREMAVYCTGCFLHLGMIQHLSRGRLKLSHPLELLAEALGEAVPRQLETRTKKMLMNVIMKPLPKMLSRKRFKVDSLRVGEE